MRHESGSGQSQIIGDQDNGALALGAWVGAWRIWVDQGNSKRALIPAGRAGCGSLTPPQRVPRCPFCARRDLKVCRVSRNADLDEDSEKPHKKPRGKKTHLWRLGPASGAARHEDWNSQRPSATLNGDIRQPKDRGTRPGKPGRMLGVQLALGREDGPRGRWRWTRTGWRPTLLVHCSPMQ